MFQQACTITELYRELSILAIIEQCQQASNVPSRGFDHLDCH